MVIFGYNYGTLLDVFNSDLNLNTINIVNNVNLFNDNYWFNYYINKNLFFYEIYQNFVENEIDKLNLSNFNLRKLSLSMPDYQIILDKLNIGKTIK